MRLYISPTMDLVALAELMSPTGDAVDPAEARAMRDLLVEHAATHGWDTTGVLKDVDWFRMLRAAVAGPTVSLALPARRFEDFDDCLTAAREKVAHDLGLRRWQTVDARWEDDQRDRTIVTVWGRA